MGNCATCKHRDRPPECTQCSTCCEDVEAGHGCSGYEEDLNAPSLCPSCYEGISEEGRLCLPCAEDKAWDEHDKRELSALRARVAELERERDEWQERAGATVLERSELRERVAELERVEKSAATALENARRLESRALAAEERAKRLEVELRGVLGAAESLLSPDSSAVDIERLRQRVSEARADFAAGESNEGTVECKRCRGCGETVWDDTRVVTCSVCQGTGKVPA